MSGEDFQIKKQANYRGQASSVDYVEQPERHIVKCDRCEKKACTFRVTYKQADWIRLLCEECWEATKDKSPHEMLLHGDP